MHSEVATDSAAEHSYDEDDAHILSPLLDETSPVRIQATKNNGSRPSSGVRQSSKGSSGGEGSSPLEMRPMMGASYKSKAITIGNGRSPSASLLMSTDRNGGGGGAEGHDERRRRRHRKMTVGSSESSSGGSSDNEGHGDAFDSNIKFS